MKVISFIAAWFIRGLHATLRVRHVRSEYLTGTPQYILAFWHGHLLLMLHCRFRRPMTVMSSRSRDGEYIARVFDWYGVNCVRGSSSRGGGAAVRGVIRAARAGSNIGFTPDGPTGPRHVAKEGVIFAAQATGLPIVPIAFAAEKKRLLQSWDRMVVPRPFTRAMYVCGPPIVVPRDGDIEEWRLKLERALNDLYDETEQSFELLWKEGER